MTSKITTKSGKVATIKVRNIGVNFGTVADLVVRGKVVETTRVYPYGNRAAAHAGAVDLAAKI